MNGHVAVVGVGLIGGSVGRALVEAGREVVGVDADVDRLAEALDRGAVTDKATSVAEAAEGADLVVVALPVAAVAEAALEALDAGAAVVTDVGSVKAPIVSAVEEQRPDRAGRFVGGHPMAGSEQEGLAGANPALFRNATWVLTPTPRTDEDALQKVSTLVWTLGAEMLAIEPARHDAMVAVTSHVPHLAAGTLMRLAAAEDSAERALMLNLAAGGFRDMTRIAAGNPGIWPDICGQNRDAIVATLDSYMESLRHVRDAVAGGDRGELLRILEAARAARTHLGARPLVEIRVPVPDRPGVLAEITTLAGQLGVNIADLEIAHTVEGGRGVLVMSVPSESAEAFDAALEEHGYERFVSPIE